jgi:hypothetical protein
MDRSNTRYSREDSKRLDEKKLENQLKNAGELKKLSMKLPRDWSIYDDGETY